MTAIQFEKLLEQYGNSIFGFCCHLTGNSELAKDLYQDSVMKAFSMLDRMKCQSDKENDLRTARNYIMGIAVRLYKNMRRKSSYKESLNSLNDEILSGIASSETDIATEAEQKEVLSIIRTLTGELPEKLRIAVYMFYYADMSIEDISGQLRIPRGTVKSRLNRARNTIRKGLEEKGYGFD